MATVEFADLVRSIGVEPTNIVISQNPLCVRDEITIEGYLSGVCSVNKQPPTQTIEDFIKRYFSPPKPQFSVKKILKNGDYMTVLWADGTKTIVKRAADEPQSDYAAFTAALAIRAMGSNSAVKKEIREKLEYLKKRKSKKKEEQDD